jgi:hypothetical protein
MELPASQLISPNLPKDVDKSDKTDASKEVVAFPSSTPQETSLESAGPQDSGVSSDSRGGPKIGLEKGPYKDCTGRGTFDSDVSTDASLALHPETCDLSIGNPQDDLQFGRCKSALSQSSSATWAPTFGHRKFSLGHVDGVAEFLKKDAKKRSGSTTSTLKKFGSRQDMGDNSAPLKRSGSVDSIASKGRNSSVDGIASKGRNSFDGMTNLTEADKTRLKMKRKELLEKQASRQDEEDHTMTFLIKKAQGRSSKRRNSEPSQQREPSSPFAQKSPSSTSPTTKTKNRRWSFSSLSSLGGQG